ncbi:UNVERIFIED_CONTAM: hypothetical protein HDU68_009862 [Siphonaria sp. JEL0065]|nr:hypothetical protein HDU68_009862 [Siphonaria sp. JEL0065]
MVKSILAITMLAASLAQAKKFPTVQHGHWNVGLTKAVAECNNTMQLHDPRPTCQQLADEVVVPLPAFAKLNPQLDCSKPLPILDAFVCVPDGFNATIAETISNSTSSNNNANATVLASVSGTLISESAIPTSDAAPSPSPSPSPSPDATPPPTSAMSSQDVNDIINAHNNFRAGLGVGPVGWDSGIAAQAAEWANYLASYSCMLQHGDTGGVGQNLAMQAGGDASMQGLFNGWAGECLDCGELNHATQAAWSSTTSIGCATAWGNWGGMGCVVLVCDYYPPGNWGGRTWQSG